MLRTLVSVIAVLLAIRLVMSQKGTTQNLQDIVEGRCLDYSISRPKALIPAISINCSALWVKFSAAWVYNAPCGTVNINYDQVLQLADQSLPLDKALFWSGTNDFAHELSQQGQRYVTLEDTLIGAIANRLHWCGTQSYPGINFTTCPSYGDCADESVSSFWNQASKWFAGRARGNIYVILNGSNPTSPAYRRNSTFGAVELPNMRHSAITKLTALVAHDLSKAKADSCGIGSLVNLQQDVTKYGIPYDCVDNPLQVKYLLCANSPDNPECSNTDTPCDRNSAGLPKLFHSQHKAVLAILISLLLVLNCLD